MASVLRMPGVSADATDAVLSSWTVTAGSQVKGGEVIAVIETDKAEVDLEAEQDGVLFRTLASPGDRVPIGDPIAVLVAPDEDTGDEAAVLAGLGLGLQCSGPLRPVDEERSQDVLAAGGDTGIAHTSDGVATADRGRVGGRIFASPLARRMAADSDLPLEGITGSGPGGRITRRDVEAALAGSVPGPAPSGPAGTAGVAAGLGAAGSVGPRAGSTDGFVDLPHTRFRRSIAAALTASKQQIPHFYLRATCRVDALLDLRQQVNAGRESKITFNDFIVKAAAQAMVAVPEMNVNWMTEAVRRFDSVDIAVAVASERSLMTPVVRSVEKRSLSDVSASIKDLAARAGAGGLRQHELEGGTMTVSNLGMFGTEEFTAIINPPQAGILAVGAVMAQPMETSEGNLGLVRAVKVVLSVDHRPVDGALAARWLQRFKELVEKPLQLLV